jgi:hypothetical protein
LPDGSLFLKLNGVLLSLHSTLGGLDHFFVQVVKTFVVELAQTEDAVE